MAILNITNGVFYFVIIPEIVEKNHSCEFDCSMHFALRTTNPKPGTRKVPNISLDGRINLI